MGASVNPEPLLVLGNQKSGTTAIAALLAEMTGASVTLDLKKEMRNPVIDRVKTSDLSMEEFVQMNKLDFSKDIIKEPSLSPLYQELASYFDRSKFVMVIRDPRDNIRSILNRLRIDGNLPLLTEQQWNGMSRAWQLIFDGRWLGYETDAYIDSLAHRWNYIADLYLMYADTMLLVRYEEFLEDKVGVITRLAETLGMPRRHDIRDKVDIQFQPAGDRTVRWDDFFGEENLGRIEMICGERMKVLGYAPAA